MLTPKPPIWPKWSWFDKFDLGLLEGLTPLRMVRLWSFCLIIELWSSLNLLAYARQDLDLDCFLAFLSLVPIVEPS